MIAAIKLVVVTPGKTPVYYSIYTIIITQFYEYFNIFRIIIILEFYFTHPICINELALFKKIQRNVLTKYLAGSKI